MYQSRYIICKRITKNQKIERKIKPFTNKYDWEGINFISEKDDWKKFEKNFRKVTIAPNILYAGSEKLYPT